MGMYGKYPRQLVDGEWREQKAWPVTDCSNDKGLTVQADRDEADINKIVARYQKSGQLPPVLRGEPFYGDVSEFGDLQDSLMKIEEANRLFMSYPANVRERFDNDPVKLMQFLGDSKNRKEAEDLGLVVPLPKAEPKPVDSPVPPAGKPAEPAKA